MNKLKVYHLFWILSVCFLIAFYFLTETGSKYIDLPMGPNYYVISIFQLKLVTLIAFLIQGLGYWFVLKILNKSLLKFLTFMHSIIFIGGMICLWCVTYVPKNLFLKETYVAYPGSIGRVNELIFTANIKIGAILLIIGLGLPIYFINLLLGIFRKNKS